MLVQHETPPAADRHIDPGLQFRLALKSAEFSDGLDQLAAREGVLTPPSRMKKSFPVKCAKLIFVEDTDAVTAGEDDVLDELVDRSTGCARSEKRSG